MRQRANSSNFPPHFTELKTHQKRTRRARQGEAIVSGFEIAYDSEEDVLEVTFETFDDHFAKTITLSERVIVYSDLMISTVWGVTIYGYAEALEAGELELEALATGLPRRSREVSLTRGQVSAFAFHGTSGREASLRSTSHPES